MFRFVCQIVWTSNSQCFYSPFPLSSFRFIFHFSSTFLLALPFGKKTVMFVFWNSLTLLALPLLVRTGTAYPGHPHKIQSALPEAWFHQRDRPVHSLFRRQAGSGLPTDGITYPQVDSPSLSPHLSGCCHALIVFVSPLRIASNSMGSCVSRGHP